MTSVQWEACHTHEKTQTQTHTDPRFTLTQRMRRYTVGRDKEIDWCRFRLQEKIRGDWEREGEQNDEIRTRGRGWRKREWVRRPGQASNTVERNETRGPKVKKKKCWPHTFSIFLFLSLHYRKHTNWDRRTPTITTNRCDYQFQFKSSAKVFMTWRHRKCSQNYSSTLKYPLYSETDQTSYTDILWLEG